MASLSSPSVPPLMKEEEPINWEEVPQELTFSILIRLGMEEILFSAQRVCKSWRRICKDPLMWRKIDMSELHECIRCNDFHSLCHHVVDLSQGGLLDIDISYYGSTDLLTYIADRSSNLRSLAFAIYWEVTNEGLVNAIAKLPLLETLEISHLSMRTLNLKAIGQACPQLQTLKLNSSGYVDSDGYALAIAGSMPELRHLQLIGDTLTETGLNAILDNLPHLKHIDLHNCFNINGVENLEKRCLERIKELRRPDDSTADCPFEIIFSNSDSDDHSDHIYSDDDDAYDYAYDDAYDYAYNDAYDNDAYDYY